MSDRDWSMNTVNHQFNLARMDRILEKAEKGYVGWDSPGLILPMRGSLTTKANASMKGEADRTTYLDIANLAMFLYAHSVIEEKAT